MKRRKPIPKKSGRQRLIERTEDLTREILKIERGNKSEISGRSDVRLGLFHILPKGLYPRIRFHKENLLLCEWLPYHYWWHHYSEKDHVNWYTVQKIKELCGANYRDRLLTLNMSAHPLSDVYIGMMYEARRQELKELKHKI